jgi:hypothetical protein
MLKYAKLLNGGKHGSLSLLRKSFYPDFEKEKSDYRYLKEIATEIIFIEEQQICNSPEYISLKQAQREASGLSDSCIKEAMGGWRLRGTCVSQELIEIKRSNIRSKRELVKLKKTIKGE